MVGQHSSNDPPLYKIILAYLAVYLIWGSTYLGIKFCLETLPTVFLLPGVRFILAGTALYVWARPRATRPTLRQWRDAAIVGGALLYIANGCVVWAQTRVPSGLTALLVAVVPICMVLLEWLRPRGTRPTPMVIAGLVLGLIGVGILTGPENLAGESRVDLTGAVVLILACFVWSAGSLFSRRAAKPSSPYLTASMQMISAGILHLASGTIAGEWAVVNLSGVSIKSAMSLLYLILFGSIIGFTAYMWLMQVSTPSRVATYAYVNPVVAVFLGWAFGREGLSSRTFLATAVIVAAVAFITSAQSRAEPISLSEQAVDTDRERGGPPDSDTPDQFVCATPSKDLLETPAQSCG